MIKIKNRVTGQKPYDPNEKGRHKPDITFLGLWDTVAAYGLPFDELTKVLNWIFPLAFPDRNLNERVHRACHALALDDERHSFHPELWNEDGQEVKKHIDDERITQVWFAGMHSNVGGSYPDDGMALVPLNWIMEQASKAEANCLKFNKKEWERIQAAANVHGKMYDSRKGAGGFYRYKPRNLEKLNHDIRDKKNPVIIEHPKIHESVFQRISNNVDSYAPIGLPSSYSVVSKDGTISGPRKNTKTWEDHQQKVWRLVMVKRCVYFISLLIFALLVSLPWLSGALPLMTQFDSLLMRIGLPNLIGFLGGFLPDMFDKQVEWVQTYQQQPGYFSTLSALYGLALSVGMRLQRRIFDEMRAGWSNWVASSNTETEN